MAEPIPDEFLDLLEKRTFAHLATLMPDGTPQVTPVWIDYDGQYILVNSARGLRKDINVEERPAVALSMVDPDYPYRYMAIRGRVVEIMHDGAEQHLEKLAQRYLGKGYPASWREPGEVRRIYKIAPVRVVTETF